MDLPIFAQTLFYLVASFLMIAFIVIVCMVAFYLIKFAQSFQKISENLENASSEITENIHAIFDRMAEIPILSFFMRPRTTSHNQRKNKNHEKNNLKGAGGHAAGTDDGPAFG